MTLCAGCVGNSATVTATPDFFTATLPPTLTTPQAAQTSTPAAPVPVATSIAVEESNVSPIEGMTTTQLNVRAEHSTASASLGMIDIFAKVQVIGRDASGSWYQIIYAEAEEGKGWVRAEYVQVDAPAEIPLVETASGSGSAVSGLVIQKVNVRNGPGTEYEMLGVLNSNDVVFITGRDADGKWIQIEFASAPDGKGWVTAEFLKAENLESVPSIGETVKETAGATPTLGAIVMSAMPDGDSMQAPLIAATFSPMDSRALQVNGDVSAPNGDVEDWIRFTTNGGDVTIQVTCSSGALLAELWSNEKPVDGFSSSCGDKSVVDITPNSDYFLRLTQNEPGYTKYILSMEIIR
jgi:uncharacterized protein YraI